MSKSNFYDVEAVPVSSSDSSLSENLLQVCRYRKSVKIFSIIDFIFGILYFASYANYYFIFTCLISLMGYYGAKEYHRCYSKTYLYWNVFLLLGQCVLMGLFINTNYGTMVDNGSLGYYIFIGLFTILIKTWITKIIYSFNKALDSVTDDDIMTLKYLQRTPVIVTYYW